MKAVVFAEEDELWRGFTERCTELRIRVDEHMTYAEIRGWCASQASRVCALVADQVDATEMLTHAIRYLDLALSAQAAEIRILALSDIGPSSCGSPGK